MVISFNHILTQVFREPSGGVVGIEVREACEFGKPRRGVIRTIRSLKGVVIACGGFGADLHFRSAQHPQLTSKFNTTNQPSATAEGLVKLMHLGAMPVQLHQIQLLPLTSPDEEGFGKATGFISGAGMAHGILVNPKTAQRFVSELADRKIQSDAIIAIGHPAATIADAYGAKLAWFGLAAALERGAVKQFDTIDALAANYQIEASVQKQPSTVSTGM